MLFCCNNRSLAYAAGCDYWGETGVIRPKAQHPNLATMATLAQARTLRDAASGSPLAYSDDFVPAKRSIR